MRLIDGDALYMRLEKRKYYEKDRNHAYLKGVRDCMKDVTTQPTIKLDSKWIPCSERLPEVNGTYLVCYEDASVLMDWFNGNWFFYRTNPAVEETGTVTAWMPLPEPYQPDGFTKWAKSVADSYRNDKEKSE